MPVTQEELIRISTQVGDALAGIRLPREIARLYSQQARLQASRPGLPSWKREEAFSLLSDATRLIQGAFLKRDLGDQTWKRDLRRSGEILEWLSMPTILPDYIPISFLAAAIYQLAGYPARALGVLNGGSLGSDFSKALTFFLKADFRLLQEEIRQYWEREEARPATADESVQEVIGKSIIKQTMQSLGVFSGWVRWGDDVRLQKALLKLKNVSRGMVYGSDAYSWLLSKLLAGIEEAGLEGNTPQQRLDLEAYIRRLWKNSFSFYSSINQNAWERGLVVRGTALVDRIYPERNLRRRLYKTSLSPREGKRVIDQLPIFERLFLQGEQYFSWSSAERRTYIENLAEAMQAVPSFAIQAPPRNQDWRALLHWWLDPTTAPIRPTSSQVSDWYKYVEKNFMYKFTWGIGSMLALRLDTAEARESNFDNWSASGLPWSAYWIKDLVTWGLLDPVAVYLLMKGIADTRAEAITKAAVYWLEWREHESDEMFDPRKLADWVRMQSMQSLFDESFNQQQVPLASQEISYPVTIEQAFVNASQRQWKVLPIQTDDTISWLDQAGYLLARGRKPEGWEMIDIKANDFLLNTDRSL